MMKKLKREIGLLQMVYYALKLGAKLQQERSYSEEEVLDIITKWEQQSSWKEFPEEWFEQFKKK